MGKGVASRLYMDAAHRGGAADLVMVKLAPGVLCFAHFEVPPAQHEGPCTAYLSWCWWCLAEDLHGMFSNNEPCRLGCVSLPGMLRDATTGALTHCLR